ncbi:MAG: hypothetical protein L0K65_08925, partial [Actinomyces sp.]|nr:hypothetical protein [Actinomyces sp.]
MARIIFDTAATLNGWIADDQGSLSWLFEVEGGTEPDPDLLPAGATVLVEGSPTYEWMLREEDLLAHPERWQQVFGPRPTFVFTSRDLPIPRGADVHL